MIVVIVASSIENHIILADVSDHFGTLTKIEGITREAEKQNLYYRKTNLTEDQWVEFDHDFLQTAKNKIRFPHLLNAKSFAQHLNGAYWVTYDKHMPKKCIK